MCLFFFSQMHVRLSCMAASFSHSGFFFVLWSYSPAYLLNSFCTGLHSFLISGSSPQADTRFVASLDSWLLSYSLSCSQHDPQTLPESQLTLHLLHTCAFSLSMTVVLWGVVLWEADEMENWKKTFTMGMWALSAPWWQGHERAHVSRKQEFHK